MLYELLSLVDLSHDTLYAHNTTTLAAERKGVESDVRSLTVRYGDVAGVVQRMLDDNSLTRLSARQALADLDALLTTAKKPGWVTAAPKFRSWLAEVARASALTSSIEELRLYLVSWTRATANIQRLAFSLPLASMWCL